MSTVWSKLPGLSVGDPVLTWVEAPHLLLWLLTSQACGELEAAFRRQSCLALEGEQGLGIQQGRGVETTGGKPQRWTSKSFCVFIRLEFARQGWDGQKQSSHPLTKVKLFLGSELLRLPAAGGDRSSWTESQGFRGKLGRRGGLKTNRPRSLASRACRAEDWQQKSGQSVMLGSSHSILFSSIPGVNRGSLMSHLGSCGPDRFTHFPNITQQKSGRVKT